ncbi:MAG: FkbM family methyltransferase [Clostridia bacterium]|nr:FkbM family methyltransferase [Clostridia bacterium]
MINYKKIIFDTFDADLWHTLKKSHMPILIYGMGNGADKIINVFESYGIEYKDVFASDGFVRGHSFRGKRVLSYSEAKEKYPNGFDIVVSFGTKLPDVIERIFSLEENHNVYSPDVPVCGTSLFCEEFFNLHENELYSARECLFDETSKEVFDDIIRYKLTGKLSYLRSTSFQENECDSLLKLDTYTSYMDLGAYNGDTIKKYTSICPNLKKIFALEPDKRNFKKLSNYCEALSSYDITILNKAIYSENKVLTFSASGNRNSSASSSGSFEHKFIEVEATYADYLTKSVDFIKYDVEGLEYEALSGSKELIKNGADLLVSMYHKSEDMYLLPCLVKELNPNYKLFLRRLPYIPAWDLNLYAIN